MTITPCKDCRLSESCEIKKEKLKAVRGLKLTAIKFRCDEQKKDIRPGMVVMALLHHVELADDEGHADYLELDGRPKKLRAVVMGWAKTGKVRVFVPLQPEGCIVNYKLMSGGEADQCHTVCVAHKCIEPTGETVTVCKHCGMPESATEDERGKWVCRQLYNDHGNWGKEYYDAGCEYPEGTSL
jgi:hypothetical protein